MGESLRIQLASGAGVVVSEALVSLDELLAPAEPE